MFYAHFVLCKKGPLSRIWLAAHWDKKLTRVHVLETNIALSVQEILEPKLKMALRTSGHLMLGIVRIYSHKARYLLNDCNQVYIKIKMSFRPGQTGEIQTLGLDEASDENTRNLMANIVGCADPGSLTLGSCIGLNLTDDVHDFEATIADLSRVDREILDVNQSRPEDITMCDDFGTEINFGRHDDDFGDSYMPECPRGGNSVEWITRDSLQIHSSSDLGMRKRPSSELELAPGLLSKRLHHEDENFNRLDEDDNDLFGATDEDMVSLMDVLGDNEIFYPPPTTPYIPRIENDTLRLNENINVDIDDNISINLEEPIHQLQTTTGTELFPLNENIDNSFAAPIAPSSPKDIVQKDEAPVKRKKRKLLIDEHKSIPSESMKAQMKQTLDITATLDLAPPTRKLMHWKEAGGVDRLLNLPGRTISSRCLMRMFHRNLKTTRPKPTSHDQSFTFDNNKALNCSNLSTAIPKNICHQDNHTNLQISLVESIIPEELARFSSGDAAHSSSIWMMDSLNLGDIQTPNQRHSSIELNQNLSPCINVEFNLDQFPDQTPAQLAPETPLYPPDSVYQEKEMEVDVMMSALDEELFNTDLNVNCGYNENPLFNQSDDQAVEDLRLEKKSQLLLKMIQSMFEREETEKTTFAALSKCNLRKMAATKFYTLLLLCKQKAINLGQDEPFMDIFITRGTNFQFLLKTS